MPIVNPKLVSFDLDGTLFPNTTSGIELARLLGHLDLVQDLEERYARFEISNAEAAQQDAHAYRGRRVSELEQAILEIPLINGFEETICRLKEHSIHILIVTLAWSFAARILVRRYGLDGYAGAVLGEENDRFTGSVERNFEDFDKPLFVRAYAERFGFSLSQCIAVGDSRSDIPLFKEAGFAVALNATEQARAEADLSLITNDLTQILPHIIADAPRQ